MKQGTAVDTFFSDKLFTAAVFFLVLNIIAIALLLIFSNSDHTNDFKFKTQDKALATKTIEHDFVKDKMVKADIKQSMPDWVQALHAKKEKSKKAKKDKHPSKSSLAINTADSSYQDDLMNVEDQKFANEHSVNKMTETISEDALIEKNILTVENDTYQALLAAHSASPNWSEFAASYQSQILDFSLANNAINLEYIDCRLSSCKLKVWHENAKEFDEYYESLSKQPWWNSIGYVREEKNANGSMEIMLVNTRLPIEDSYAAVP